MLHAKTKELWRKTKKSKTNETNNIADDSQKRRHQNDRRRRKSAKHIQKYTIEICYLFHAKHLSTLLLNGKTHYFLITSLSKAITRASVLSAGVISSLVLFACSLLQKVKRRQVCMVSECECVIFHSRKILRQKVSVLTLSYMRHAG